MPLIAWLRRILTRPTMPNPNVGNQPAPAGLLDFYATAFKVHDLNSVGEGLRSGASIAAAIAAFRRSGFSDQQIADELEMVMQTYSSTAWIPEGSGGKPLRQYQPAYFGGVKTYPINWQEPEEFIDPVSGQIAPVLYAGRPMINIGAENTLQIVCSPDVEAATASSLAAMIGKTSPPFWQGVSFTPDMAWLGMVIAESSWNPDSSIGAAFEYTMQGFDAVTKLLFGMLDHDLTLLLGYGYEILSRFYGVTALGANLAAKCIATAKQYKLEYGLADLVSSVPIDPDSKAYLKANSQYYTPIPFPRLSEVSSMLALQGYPIFVPNGDPRGVGFQAPEGITGKPLTSPVDVNRDFGNVLYRTTYPARLAAYAALGGNKRNLFYYPTPDTIPDIVVQGSGGPTGEAVTIPGGPTATAYAAPTLLWKDPKQPNGFALPVFADNGSWNDLEASVKAGLATEQQVFNLVDQGIAVDPAINDLLFVHPDAAVTAAWDASHKNAAYLRTLYLRVKPQQPSQ